MVMKMLVVKKMIIFMLPIFSLFLSLNGSHAKDFCVDTESKLYAALTNSQSNGSYDTIRIVTGIYNGNFIYASSEKYGLKIEGGYSQDCTSRTRNPSATVLDGNNSGSVLVVSVNKGVQIDIKNVTVRHGNANQGGGIYAYCGGIEDNTKCSISITNSIFTENSAGKGGGAYLDTYMNWSSFGAIVFDNNLITNNSADYGGGVFTNAFNSAEIKLINNLFLHNSSNGSGGGINTSSGLNGRTILYNNILAKNSAQHGGGAFLDHYDGDLYVINNDVIENSSTQTGGGIRLDMGVDDSRAFLHNNIIWENLSGSGNDIYIQNDWNNNYLPSLVRLLNNDFDKTHAGLYIQIPFSVHSSNLNANPLLIAPANGNFYLRKGSPCINAGNNNAPELPLYDKSGSTRIYSSTVDMGAYEYRAPFRSEFRSQATGDGWVLESAEASGKGGSFNKSGVTFRLGDDASNRQYRSILSFDTSTLPDDAIISEVKLRINKQNLVGADPFTSLGNIILDVRRGAFSNNDSLQITDFQAIVSMSKAGIIRSKPLRGSWYGCNLVTDAFKFINRTGLTQFRLEFITGTNKDRVADYMRFYSGNAGPAYQPELIVSYYKP